MIAAIRCLVGVRRASVYHSLERTCTYMMSTLTKYPSYLVWARSHQTQNMWREIQKLQGFQLNTALVYNAFFQVFTSTFGLWFWNFS
jgi:hypothetical protein